MKTKIKKSKKYIINIILIIIMLAIVTYLVTEIKEEKNISKNIHQKNSTIIQEDNIFQTKNSNNKKEKLYPKENIEKIYKGYNVCAKLNIPAIQLETYILSTYSKEALNISVTKFWGSNPNRVGNFCVAGHNFINKNMFRNLRKLKIGDRLTISDNEIGKVEYEIFEINTVIPEDVSCLDACFQGEKEVTLITCTNDSLKRVIVKAKEI